MTDKLSSLRKMTTVVADTGDITAIKRYQPQDATTNPSLILNAAQIPEYRGYIDDALSWARGQSNDRAAQVNYAADKLAVNIGREILKWVPGRISTEVDARLSYDTEASVANQEPGETLQRCRYRQRTHFNQAGLDLAGHSRRRTAGKGGDQL